MKLTATPEVTALTEQDMTVSVGNENRKFTVLSTQTPNVFEIRVEGGLKTGDKVDVALKAGGVLTGTMPNAVGGLAEQGTTPPQASPDAAKAGDINVKVDTSKSTLLVQVLEGAVTRAARAAGDPITTLTAADFKVTVGTKAINDIEANYDLSAGVYKLTSKSVSDWTTATMKNVTVAVGTASETIAQLNATAQITDDNNTVDFIKGTKEDVVFTPTLTNLFPSDVKLKDGADAFVTYDEKTGKITVLATELEKKQNNNQVQFTLESKTDASNVKVEYTITVKDAPKLADTKGSVTTQGAAEVPAVAAKATFDVTYKGAGQFNVKVDSGKNIAVTAATGNNETAQAIRDALNKESTVTDKYTVSGSNAQVILTAKTPGAAVQNIELTTDTQDKATVAINGTVTPGKDVVAAVPGVVDFTFAADAVTGDAGQWTLTVNTKTFQVTLAGTEKANEIAKKLETEINKDSDLGAVASDAKLTITEKASKEGTIVSSKGITTTFVKG